MWPIVSTKLIKLCYDSTANTCLINRNNNFKIAKTHTWWVKALRTPSSLRANETKSSQIAFSPKYCWVCKASGTDNEAAETPAWVCTSQLKSQEGVSAGKSMKILRRGCCWGFSSSAPPDSSRPPPSSSSPLEASASPPPPRTQAGRPGNRWKCNPNISTAGCFYVTKYLNLLFLCYLEGEFEIITRHLVIGGRRQGGSWPTRQRDFETGGQGDPLFENCVVAELKGDSYDFLYLGLKTECSEWFKLWYDILGK